jgi:TolB-like protein
MTKKYLVAALFAVFFCTAAMAKEKLAVLPFSGGTGDEGETIAELFSFSPDITAVFDPVPRTSISDAIAREQIFQYESGMTDPDTVGALGRQLGAKFIVSGMITALGRQKLLIIAILDVQTLRQVAGNYQAYSNIGEIRRFLPAMAKNIAKRVAANDSLPRLAVVPVMIRGGADAKSADALAQILAINIIKNGKYAVYPRTSNLEQVQAEYQNQFSGIIDDVELPNIGYGVNPELVLSVTARKLGSDTMFNAAVINLRGGFQERGSSTDYTGLEDGIRAMENLARELSGLKGGGGGKLSLAAGVEGNANSLDGFAAGVNISGNYLVFNWLSLGIRAGASYDFNDTITFEAVFLPRWNIFSWGKTGAVFAQAGAGISLFSGPDIIFQPVFLGEGGLGIRIPIKSIYLEPYLRFGYPFFWGAIASLGFTL